jgi:hypothetical protein
MADALDTYLNDHLAGAMFGSDLAEQLRERSEGSPLGEALQSLAPQIEEDRQTLIDLMERLGTTRNPVKEATTWLAEKASRAKFGGVRASETGLGTFMALESLSLGVEGDCRQLRTARLDGPRRANRARAGATLRTRTRAPRRQSARTAGGRLTAINAANSALAVGCSRRGPRYTIELGTPTRQQIGMLMVPMTPDHPNSTPSVKGSSSSSAQISAPNPKPTPGLEPGTPSLRVKCSTS